MTDAKANTYHQETGNRKKSVIPLSDNVTFFSSPNLKTMGITIATTSMNKNQQNSSPKKEKDLE